MSDRRAFLKQLLAAAAVTALPSEALLRLTPAADLVLWPWARYD